MTRNHPVLTISDFSDNQVLLEMSGLTLKVDVLCPRVRSIQLCHSSNVFKEGDLSVQNYQLLVECYTKFIVEEIEETIEEISFNKKRKIQVKREKVYHEVIVVINEIRATWGKAQDL